MRDEAFEALCNVCSIDWQGEITSDQRGRVNAALKQLRTIYPEDLALPMMIHERAAAWAVVHPEIPLTPQALTGNWSSILQVAEQTREQLKRRETEKRRVTNAHARRGCTTCGDDHFVSVGYDANGNEQVAPCPDCGPKGDASYWVQRRKVEVMDPAKTREMMAPPEQPPDDPPVVLPEIPLGRGHTAKEAADALEPDADGWRRDTVRRRVQELHNPYRLLDVIGERPRTGSGEDNRVYHSNAFTREALATWDSGERWATDHLVRRDDPRTSQDAVRHMNPNTDFHRVIAFYIRSGS